MWRRLWKLKVPGKVRHFIWRACNEALPTKFNLHRKKIPVDPRCTFCEEAVESTSHILWECPLANGVWSSFRGKLQKRHVSNEEFQMITKSLVEFLSKEELEEWAILSWSIWNARNSALFEGVKISPVTIFEKGMGLLQEFQRMQVTAVLTPGTTM